MSLKKYKYNIKVPVDDPDVINRAFIGCLACGNLRFKSREEHAFLLSIML